MRHKRDLIVVTLLIVLGVAGCNSCKDKNGPTGELRGASSYTPYDALSMLWSQGRDEHSIVWVNSGGDAGQLLTSSADPARRPDWILCTQGVVASLAAKGEKVVIIATTYISDDVILPIFRQPKKPLIGSRSLFIPRTSIELAFDRLLQREGVSRDQVKIPQVENTGFQTISSLLEKPAGEKDAIDFAVLVEPFITNLINGQPNQFEIGNGGLYEIHYSVVVRESDLKARRQQFVGLLRQLLEADNKLHSLYSDDEFYSEVWGRMKDNKPQYLPRMLTYKRGPARLQLQVGKLRGHLQDELQYLTSKYPNELRMPTDVDSLVDPSLLQEIAPDRVNP
jgi:ABC-type nitrate/sulfonate/bicarbonate transport system substrate-binding protein